MKHNVLKSILCSLLIVALLAAPVSALAASNVAYILKVAVSDAPGTYVRSGSGQDNNAVIGSLPNGTKVLYCGQSIGQMLLVMTASGQTGYVYQGNLATYGAASKSRVFLTSTTTSLYNSSMQRSGTVGAGVPVIVFGVSGEWALCRNINGTPAYISTSALKSIG